LIKRRLSKNARLQYIRLYYKKPYRHLLYGLNMKPVTTCYMCETPATSREHAPPICFFPEETDIGRDFRQNLITVPSCDRHNSIKSKDDEYFRAVIVMQAAQNSDAGRHQFFRKLLRASARSPHAYQSFFQDKGTITGGKGHALQIDRDRFDSCIDHLARALFFDTFKSKWTPPITVISPNFFKEIKSDNVVPHQPTISAVEVSRQMLGGELIKGQNPEIFKYRLLHEESAKAFAFAAIFYDSFEVFTFSSHEINEMAV